MALAPSALFAQGHRFGDRVSDRIARADPPIPTAILRDGKRLLAFGPQILFEMLAMRPLQGLQKIGRSLPSRQALAAQKFIDHGRPNVAAGCVEEKFMPFGSEGGRYRKLSLSAGRHIG